MLNQKTSGRRNYSIAALMFVLSWVLAALFILFSYHNENLHLPLFVTVVSAMIIIFGGQGLAALLAIKTYQNRKALKDI